MYEYQQVNRSHRKPWQVALCACLSSLLGCASAAAVAKPPRAPAARPAVTQTVAAAHAPVVSRPSAFSCAAAPVYFPLDSSSLDGAARSQLEQEAQCIEHSPSRHMEIIGMADPRGTEEYNLALGERRADAAATYVTTLGVQRDKVRAHSVGEEYAKGNEESGWAHDRRDDVHLQ
jgi:peptidoglycan-associated lipoprotein